ncbi:hypothetical protein N7474_003912 [Penicillium riverlandense]|uniref:uncharacterized protein n=1 Tax=Penicillium riverlandense TaxID=1903569 RepID=UPI00254677FB|nr:uncharacterized protein N7474_003912 [Penicillium riverlandense]KAJ5818321.1 hypothetical protein N7474_003912 [Penicillium riverlandense]
MTTQPQSIIPLPLWVLVPLGIVVIPTLPFVLAYSKSKKKFEDWKKKAPPVRPEYVLAPPGDQVLHVAAISGRLCGIRCYETDPYATGVEARMLEIL